MSFHKSNLGSFGENIQADMDGYIPDATDGPFDLNYDHGTEATHDAHGELTEYGEWWTEERFPEIQAAAIKATKQAEEGIREWQNSN